MTLCLAYALERELGAHPGREIAHGILPAAVLVSGTVLSAVLAAMVYLALGSKRRAEGTQLANTRLEREISEFPTVVLDHLRQPLEEGVIRISRAQTNVELPASIARTRGLARGWSGCRQDDSGPVSGPASRPSDLFGRQLDLGPSGPGAGRW